ncbi:MAG: helix-turn-helix transcriptional regulator [Clostridia bacterium]|nr:helix-turn-helix transcriptional regulator [Clostridia bacterium]
MSADFNIDYTDCLGFKSPNMHCHKYSELIFVLNGELNFLVEDKVYHSSGSCLIFFKEKQFHTTDVDPSVQYTRYNTTFRYKHLSDILEYEAVRELYEQDCAVIPLSDEQRDEMLSIIKPIFDICESKSEDVCQIQLSRHMLCAMLIKVNMMVKQQSSGADLYVDTYINKVLDYIKKNLTEKLLVEEIADMFYISRSKLMTDFKKVTGITIGDYVLCNRIKLSKELLMSGKSVNETAVLSGFVNTSHFIRTFKNETGKTPLQYCRSKI